MPARKKGCSIELKQLQAAFSGHVPGLLGATAAYAVLVPVAETAEGLSLLYEVRSPALHHHSGEVCFPGGRMEPGETPEEAAVREIWEELHVERQQIEILGPLDRMVHFTGTVYPLLGRMDALALPNLKLNEDEVEEVFTVPLEFFLSCPGKQYTYYMSPDLSLIHI